MGGLSSRTPDMSRQRVPAYSTDPDKAWSILRVKRKVETVPTIDPNSPTPPGHTRFVCISGERGRRPALVPRLLWSGAEWQLTCPAPSLPTDTHTRTDNLKLPEGDVLIHAGDFSNIGLPKDVDKFRRYLDSQSFPYKVSSLWSKWGFGVHCIHARVTQSVLLRLSAYVRAYVHVAVTCCALPSAPRSRRTRW